MAKYISNRNGGKTDEQGHYRFHVNAWDGNILNDGLKVKQNSPLGMSVLIEPGDVKIDYSTYSYTGWNDADEAVTIATADGSNPRIDRIVAYVDRVMTPNPSNSNNPGMLKFMSVAGTPAGSPSPVSDAAVNTAVSNNPWCELAQVQVNSGASTITNGSITDKRTIATPKIADGAVTNPKLDITSSTDANGWKVTTLGTTKYYRKRVTFSQTIGGLAVLIISSSVLPVGVSTIGTRTLVYSPVISGSAGVILINFEGTSAHTFLNFTTATTEGSSRTVTGFIDVMLIED